MALGSNDLSTLPLNNFGCFKISLSVCLYLSLYLSIYLSISFSLSLTHSHTHTHTHNLSLSLSLSLCSAFFLLQMACKCTAAFLHYFLLAVFCLMLVEASLAFSRVVLVFETFNFPLKTLIFLAWGKTCVCLKIMNACVEHVCAHSCVRVCVCVCVCVCVRERRKIELTA